MGNSSDKNDKTQLLSDSQVLEVKPSPAKPPVDDKNDRSVWRGVVVGADEFAPPPAAKSSGSRWVVIAILVVAALGAGGYFAWSKLLAPAAVPDAAKPAQADAMPQDAAPVVADARAAVPAAVPAEVIDAASAEVIDAGADAGVDAGVKPIRRRPPPKHQLKHKTR